MNEQTHQLAARSVRGSQDGTALWTPSGAPCRLPNSTVPAGIRQPGTARALSGFRRCEHPAARAAVMES